MVQAINGPQAIAGRISVTSKLSPDAAYWRSGYMGGRPSGVVVDDPLQGPGEGRAVADLPVAAFEAADDGKLVIESDYGD